MFLSILDNLQGNMFRILGTTDVHSLKHTAVVRSKRSNLKQSVKNLF